MTNKKKTKKRTETQSEKTNPTNLLVGFFYAISRTKKRTLLRKIKPESSYKLNRRNPGRILPPKSRAVNLNDRSDVVHLCTRISPDFDSPIYSPVNVNLIFCIIEKNKSAVYLYYLLCHDLIFIKSKIRRCVYIRHCRHIHCCR